MRSAKLYTVLVGVALGACAGGDEPSAPPSEALPTDVPATPDGPRDPLADFDRERARAEAQALLGAAESQLQEAPDLRIVRRGEERRPVTMDLRPGRKNVELDDDGTGRYVVTRVAVEVPEGTMVVE